MNGKYDSDRYDLIIVGAGLSGLLLAYRMHLSKPSLKFVVLEKQKKFNKNKTWSFHHDDVEDMEFWGHLVTHHWHRYEVRFNFDRILNQNYYSMRASDFFEKMTNVLGDKLLMNSSVQSIGAGSVQLADGRCFVSDLIIDSRDDGNDFRSQTCVKGWGFQKFAGLEIKLKNTHGLRHPLLMDATVTQKEGYRFFYVLPYSEDILFIEDTRYSDSAFVDIEDFKAEILKYVAQNGWEVESVLFEESGSLPIPLYNFSKANNRSDSTVLKIGAGAGFYHPVTGYTFLWASKVADRLSRLSVLSPGNVQKQLNQLRTEHHRNNWFYILLNKLMFLGASADQRRKIFARFYRLNDNTIRRFYASKSNIYDRFCLLVGKPPISILNAVKAIFTRIEESA